MWPLSPQSPELTCASNWLQGVCVCPLLFPKAHHQLRDCAGRQGGRWLARSPCLCHRAAPLLLLSVQGSLAVPLVSWWSHDKTCVLHIRKGRAWEEPHPHPLLSTWHGSHVTPTVRPLSQLLLNAIDPVLKGAFLTMYSLRAPCPTTWLIWG